ncbi:hypothetical protein EV421DRAFT_1902726 [Armillaria borealis]|uniref:Thioester reductase (TE) domain-containing protein n=1 Tax=Armillaria borealis TaxID=47425 RepID=A0AA39JMH5_9AGAR|nr:hypothetical protein EV421DRAFT_1902726 [Armillaria borealis]
MARIMTSWYQSCRRPTRRILQTSPRADYGLPHWCNWVGAILHNGALVHWVYPYEKLQVANVISTLTAIGKQKLVVFVSSTSTIDTDFGITD